MKKRTTYNLLFVIGCFAVIFFWGCKLKANPEAIEHFCNHQLPDWNSKLTQVIISDIFTQAVYSRI